MFQEVKEGIIEELKKGDQLASQLQSSLNIQRSPDFWTAIAQLKEERKISHYLVKTPPSVTLAYTLIK